MDNNITYNKLFFYLSYFYYKFFIFREVKKGRGTLYLAEIIWMIGRFIKPASNVNKNNFLTYCETKFGKFHINPDLLTNIAVSPGFERLDINYLLKIMEKDVKAQNKILFIDIGAYFGLYTILIGNAFRRYKKLDIISFEPGTEYLSFPTLDLLKMNISENHLKNVRLFALGLGSQNSKNADNRGIKTKKLDSIFESKFANKYDKVYIKLDVDGSEIDVLEGATEFISNTKNITLLIEDFVKFKKVTNYLKKNDFTFIAKRTPYNSFWQYTK